MRRDRKRLERLVACSLCALLICNSMAPVEAAESHTYEQLRSGNAAMDEKLTESEYTVLEISTEEELAELAGQCQLDAWSRDKHVKLKNDIQLSGDKELMIPSFGGIFDGGGNRILGLSLQGKGSEVGLFRYVQENAIVKDLTVEGSVLPEGSQSRIGILAGVNYGKILNCSVQGTVEGDTDVGGLVGVNESTGEIRRCSSDVSVSGSHSTGGICGSNFGILNNCSNQGDINIYSTEVAYTKEDLTMESLEEINSASNTAVHTDTGGVAGYSEGKMYYCSNAGKVGYQHVGYNVGGIAGRLHQGYIQNCTNTGIVLGRKDVGGIAGQMEPFLEIQYMNDKLQEIDREADYLIDLLDRTHSDLDSYGKQASDLTKKLTTSLKNIQGAAGNLTNTTNELWYLYNQELTGMASDFDRLGNDLESQGKADKENGNTTDITVSGGDIVSGGDAGGGITIKVPNDAESYKAAVRRFGDSAGNRLSNITGATSDKRGAVTESLNTFNREMEAAGNYMSQLADVLGQGTDKVSADMDALVVQMRVLRRSISELRDDLFRYEGITTEDASDEAAGGDMTNLGAERDSGGQKGSDGQGNPAGKDASDDQEAPAGQGGPDDQDDSAAQDFAVTQEDEAFYDTSSFQQGKITLCVNKGSVEADTNTGGIVGQIATEYDFDPEDDISISGAESFRIEQTLKAVVRESLNLGDVTAKKDYAGGIVGKADFGAVISCESYGGISSTGGSFVGGIAGSSGYAIRSCYAMGDYSGKNYVGGIAGMGCDIFYSYAYPALDVTGECGGSIAGQIAEDGILAGNYYVKGDVPGVDAIGFSEGASPLSYEEFCSMEGVPDAFSEFTVSFQADGVELASFRCHYGDSIDSARIPAIPRKEGYYGEWPEFDFRFVSGNKILEAQYEKWIPSLAGAEKDEDGKARYLVQGQFLPGAVLQVTESEGSLAEDGNEAENEPGTAEAGGAQEEQEAQDVSGTDAEGGVGSTAHTGNADTMRTVKEVTLEVVYLDEGGKETGRYDGPLTVRALCDDPEKTEVEVWQDGAYAEVPAEVMGSYLEFTLEGDSFRLIEERDGSGMGLVFALAGAGGAGVVILLVKKIVGRRRKRTEERR